MKRKTFKTLGNNINYKTLNDESDRKGNVVGRKRVICILRNDTNLKTCH